ncbi:hypothetical protein ElyMa_003674300 [Elysia marginata]|uniref:Reverse transcriptase zinc-binding domain-containing protein n=1 Tax=Elysia marginata TaxID=1093978 RepID=A0AAV4F0T3_9GAST|nr:hypothetical protein ElyMa_003674300 [Elysia marginata]
MAAIFKMAVVTLVITMTLVSATPVERERRFIRKTLKSVFSGAKKVAGKVKKVFTRRNRLRTRHAKTAYMLHKWKMKGSPMCERCSKDPETTYHIILNCPATKLDGGYETVQKADKDLVAWINKYNPEL